MEMASLVLLVCLLWWCGWGYRCAGAMNTRVQMFWLLLIWLLLYWGYGYFGAVDTDIMVIVQWLLLCR